MKIKLTGIVEVQVESDAEIDDPDHFYEWCGGPVSLADIPDLYIKYLRDHPDEETEKWKITSRIEDGDVLTAEFVEAEVLGE